MKKIESLVIAVVEKYKCNVMKSVPLNDDERRECDWKDKTCKYVDVLKKVMGEKKTRERRNIKRSLKRWYKVNDKLY